MKHKSQPKATVRCAIYTRKSTEDGLEQEFNSLDAQREAGEAYVTSQRREGWLCLPDRYDDGGYSGGNTERPGLRQLLADIEADKIDCVVVYKVDRLSRSLFDFAGLMEVFERHHVSFVSVTQQFNTTHSMGRLTLNILLSFAQFEREIIGERIRDKIAAQKRKGKWAGGKPILGYDVDRTGPSPKLVINGEEAARVREIFELYLELGSLLPVVDELAERGWCNKAWKTRGGKPKGGRPFDKGSLHALLTNPLYAGKIKHKSEVFDGEHEPLVDAVVFQQVQARLEQNGRSGNETRNRHGALLRGLLFCKACGHTMVHTFTEKGTRRYRYYTCAHAIKSGRNVCPTRSLPAAEIEQAVVDEIRGLAEDAELGAEVLRQAQWQLVGDVDALRRERDDLTRETARHHSEIEELATGEQASATTRRLADLHDRIARAEQRLAELKGPIAEAERECIGLGEVEAILADFDSVWNALSPRERARVVSLVVSRVEFDVADDSIAISFHPMAISALARRKGDAA